jgi:uncharacterized integral membrane protein (TIGR00698 family)
MSLPLSSHRNLLPGVALCAAIAVAAVVGDAVQNRIFGHASLEALVLAILVGAAVRSIWAPPSHFKAGVTFSAQTLLEAAVVLLGLSLSAASVIATGPALIGGIVIIVIAAIAISYCIGRIFRLPHKMALLIACGNSICGNSAIAAAAPVIRADGEDVATSIAFTAVLGVLVVLLLPLVAQTLHLNEVQYGIFAGLTVYAVPQVLAAAAPVGATSVHIGTLVKLVRVLMLGPVLFILSQTVRDVPQNDASRRELPLRGLAPPFILGFVAMILVRSTGLIPPTILSSAATGANGLTVMAMAALGLSVDIRAVAKAGVRVSSVVVLSLLALGTLSLMLIVLLGVIP